jgi:hypothetical protein
MKNAASNGSSQSSDDNKKDEKYIRQLKELPPIPEEVPEAPKKEVVKEKMTKTSQKDLNISAVKKIAVDKETELDNIDDVNKKPKLPFTFKDIMLGIINLVSVILLVIILFKLPAKAKEYKAIRLENLGSDAAVNIEQNSIDEAKEKVEVLQSLYLDESGVVDFVNDVESLKSEGGSILGVSFASQRAVKDKTGNYGVPVVIELSGSWSAIASDLQRIEKLSYLFRPVNLDIKRDVDDPNVIIFDYGIILYVNEELGEN